MGSYILSAFLALFLAGQFSECADVKGIARELVIRFDVITNGDVNNLTVDFQLQLMNAGSGTLKGGDWAIYFCYIRMIEPDILSKNASAVYYNNGFSLRHVEGCLYQLRPPPSWMLPSQQITALRLLSEFWVVSRTDIMPNWYIASDSNPSMQAVVKNTQGESLDFIGSFSKKEQYKRLLDLDRYSPFTPEVRFDMNKGHMDRTAAEVRFGTIPNLNGVMEKNFSKSTAVDNSWKIIVHTDTSACSNASRFLSGATGLEVVTTCDTKCIRLQNTTFTLFSDPANQQVVINCAAEDTAFYSIQTFLSFWRRSEIPHLKVTDTPRFQYRGFMLDISRNFHNKAAILKLLPVLGQYKINKLHLHLTDDEGWRLEIEGISELTELGAKDCHDLSQESCLLPQLGHTMTAANERNFLSKEDYVSIVQEAAKYHIEVIPEIDLPGHANAAILAMQARKRNNVLPDYLLSDPLPDPSEYISVQYFRRNAVNPCINTTYDFIDKVVSTVKSYHQLAGQPMKTMHLGGDEVGKGAWLNSTSCIQLSNQGLPDTQQLKKMYLRRIIDIAKSHQLNLGLWEDALIGSDQKVFTIFNDYASNIYAYYWQNVWEWGAGDRAHKLANAGYKVVLMPATHNYFDFPYEPEPEDRGYYWATRFTDTHKTFNFKPDDIFSNIKIDRWGGPLTEQGICTQFNCTSLDETRRDNIIGYQGGVWSETVRTEEQLHQMMFPRMLAVAERAWYTAPWLNGTGAVSADDDYMRFSAILSSYELDQLSRHSVGFHVKPPGVKLNNTGQPSVNTEFQQFTVEVPDQQNNWVSVRAAEFVSCQGAQPGGVFFRSRHGSQTSRQVLVPACLKAEAPKDTGGAHQSSMGFISLCISFLSARIVYSQFLTT